MAETQPWALTPIPAHGSTMRQPCLSRSQRCTEVDAPQGALWMVFKSRGLQAYRFSASPRETEFWSVSFDWWGNRHEKQVFVLGCRTSIIRKGATSKLVSCLQVRIHGSPLPHSQALCLVWPLCLLSLPSSAFLSLCIFSLCPQSQMLCHGMLACVEAGIFFFFFH